MNQAQDSTGSDTTPRPLRTLRSFGPLALELVSMRNDPRPFTGSEANGKTQTAQRNAKYENGQVRWTPRADRK
jgi:hypothetical protein